MCLTILSEEQPIRWCLLNVKILVENSEVGYGQKLVHPLQIHYIHQIVQQKINKFVQVVFFLLVKVNYNILF